MARVVAMMMPLLAAPPLGAQDAADPYYDAVAAYFRVSPEEVAVLGEWNLPPDEVPVVLYLSRRAGVSPDLVVAQRSRGAPWPDIARGYGVTAGDFHVPLDEGQPTGSLSRAYGEYRARPRSEWSGIRLEDPEIVTLVNVRVLSQALSAPPGTVLEAGDRAGSFHVGVTRMARRR